MQPRRAQPNPPQPHDPNDSFEFVQWRGSPQTQAVLRRLADENEAALDNLLSSFSNLGEIKLKLELQKIKTRKDTIVCLTKIPTET